MRWQQKSEYDGTTWNNSSGKRWRGGDSHISRGRPYHPQTQGKIERWHRSMKNQILLENYYLPGDLKRALKNFVSYYNYERYHESLSNLTPADVFYGRGQEILDQREMIKRSTLAICRKMHYDNQVLQLTQMS